MRELLAGVAEKLTKLFRERNAHHYQAQLEAMVAGALVNDYRPVLKSNRQDPLTSFLRHHAGRKDIPALLAALEEGNETKIDTLLNHICSDGWHAYLRTVSRSNTQSFFAYLAKAEGRKRWGYTPRDSTPLFHNGAYVLSNREKCTIIAEAFRDKFKASVDTDAIPLLGQREDLPLGPFRQSLTGEPREVTIVEVRRAIRTLAPSKTPGPDGFPGGVYKNLPVLVPHLTRVMNLIYRTGVIPKALRRVHLVPIPKPGRDPHLLSARRPISLLSTAAKVMEAVLYHRMMPVVDPALAPQQYAY